MLNAAKLNHCRYEAKITFEKVDAEDTSAATEHLVRQFWQK